MPSQVRIISPKNSAAWDELVAGVLSSIGLGKEQTYGGITDEARADTVRKKVRTAARKKDVASKVFYRPCDSPGNCSFGDDCQFHVLMTFFPLDAARQYKAQQSQPKR
jgi:hypothetical protein